MEGGKKWSFNPIILADPEFTEPRLWCSSLDRSVRTSWLILTILQSWLSLGVQGSGAVLFLDRVSSLRRRKKRSLLRAGLSRSWPDQSWKQPLATVFLYVLGIIQVMVMESVWGGHQLETQESSTVGTTKCWCRRRLFRDSMIGVRNK